MKPRTLLLFSLLIFLVLATAAWFHLQHDGNLHHAGVQSSISKSGALIWCMEGGYHQNVSWQNSYNFQTIFTIPPPDHDHYLQLGIDCEEVYHVQGYEGPESVLR